MSRPCSPHFTTIGLGGAFNGRRRELAGGLRPPSRFADAQGPQTIRGMPFVFGAADGADAPDVVRLEGGREIAIELGGARATYVLFVHAVEDVVTTYREGLADDQTTGWDLGQLVSEYELEYDDGSTVRTPILRRFAIQQSRCEWGSAPFACVPAADDAVFLSGDEVALRGRPVLEAAALPDGPELGLTKRELVAFSYGLRQQTRTAAPGADGHLWIYALPNAEPGKPLSRLTLRPREAASAVYAVTLTDLAEHPLRRGTRQKLRVRLPEGVQLDAADAIDDVAVDLGTVISVRPALDYDAGRWASAEPMVEPSRSDRDVIVEYAAHPAARLHVGDLVHEVGEASSAVTAVASAQRPVRLRFVDGGSGAGVAVRLHLHGEAGEYLPPRGHHRRVDITWGQDTAAEFVNVENQYAYVDGECVADLPLGTVFLEATRGCEVAPLRTSFEVGPETDELVFELRKALRWRERGWVTADTHVHFLSPQTALLEGRAEGVNVVNLLASQWGEMFSSVGDFDGATTFGANELGGDGEFLVRVGSENRMHVLGHISLLGYTGQLIQPLCTGGPEESALGDPLEVTMAEWAQRCLDQGGLVVMPHAPTPQLERAADIVLGVVDAVELTTFNPFHPSTAADYGQLNAYGVADWYRYLNLGYHLPLVGGSDKMSAGMLLGGIRTYARLGDGALTYEHWMDAIRVGNTFATVGPLASLRVEGIEPGGRRRLPASGGSVQVEWEVESVRVPIDRVELIVGGAVQDEIHVGGERSARGRAAIPIARSTWVALRVRGSCRGQTDEIAAHTSAVQVLVEGSELFSEPDATAVLDQIQGAIAYVDTLATRPDPHRLGALRATLETAHDRLQRRIHAAGAHHRHALHDADEPHEH